MAPAAITVRGLRQHTLRNVDVDVPLGKLVAVVGVSGSGKSSLAMGALYAEGLQRFLGGLSAYSRRRMAQVERPDVDEISHLPAALAVLQRPPIPGPRSTVGTMTEALNTLRLVMSRLGTHRCPNGHEVQPSLATEGLDITCPVCGSVFEHPSAESFAFNGSGACPACNGLGHRLEADVDALVPDASRTLAEGAVRPWTAGTRRLFRDAAGALGVRLDVPYGELSKRERELVLHGPPVRLPVKVNTRAGRTFSLDVTYENAVATAERAALAGGGRDQRFVVKRRCSVCGGTRLRPEALRSRLGGRSIAEITAFELRQTRQFARGLTTEFADELRPVTDRLLGELTRAVEPLIAIGLDYLSLDRDGATLSAGERRRIHLNARLLASATGMLYVLDEPSAGLHASAIAALQDALKSLVDDGNSVVVVEHDLRLIRGCDWVIELGPGAGEHGGEIVAQGTPAQIEADKHSLIAPFLTGRATVVRAPRRTQPAGTIELAVRRLHNLRDVRVTIPVHALTAVAGPSGAGKSALVLEGLLPAVRAALTGKPLPRHVESLSLTGVRGVVAIDGSPVGRNARSTPATYTGAWDGVRALFAATPEARRRGFTARRFSFNAPEGQCPACRGLGSIEIDVQYLPAVTVPCSSCHGSRFNPDTLTVRLDGLTAADVLALTVEQALERFASRPAVARPLGPLADAGLGYLRLGAPTPSLSGGESQRLRIASRLRASQRDILYILDEPSTGLHPLDLRTLLDVFDRLLAGGATIIFIDHDLDLLAAADHLIDLGPGGGPQGGRIVAEGAPAALAARRAGATGRWLA